MSRAAVLGARQNEQNVGGGDYRGGGNAFSEQGGHGPRRTSRMSAADGGHTRSVSRAAARARRTSRMSAAAAADVFSEQAGATAPQQNEQNVGGGGERVQ